jgi:hypothetical protein
MTPLEQQFELLRKSYPNAILEMLPSGAALVTVPEIELPRGWSQPRTTVKFLAPVGYPLARPDCFWADTELRLEGGAMPNATNLTPIPDVNVPQLWFSWHVGQWNPNRDGLLSYFRVILERLRNPQ